MMIRAESVVSSDCSVQHSIASRNLYSVGQATYCGGDNMQAGTLCQLSVSLSGEMIGRFALDTSMDVHIYIRSVYSRRS